MARVYLYERSEMRVLYGIDEPVGTGCRNKQDDVLLVQFFLKVISETPGKEVYRPEGKGDLMIDGIWGPVSQAYLNQFLTTTNRLNPGEWNVKVDGRVDPIKGRSPGAESTHMEYTLHRMQTNFRTIVGTSIFNDITRHPRFPPLLSNSIKKFL